MIRNINITIADRDIGFFNEIKTMILSDSVFENCQISHCDNGASLRDKLRETNCDVLITELCLPTCDPYDQITSIKEEFHELRIIIISQYDHRKFVKDVFLKGVDGYILKKNLRNELVESFVNITKNNPYMGQGVSIGPRRERELTEDYLHDPFLLKHRLTKREIEILSLLERGHSTKEIASQLYISEQTVSVHRKNILKKFGVRSTSRLLDMAVEKSIL